MADGGRPDHKAVIGSVMVLVGLGFFVTIFAVLFPVLTNPSGAYDRWFPSEVVDESAETRALAADSDTDTNTDGSLAEAPTIGPTARFTWEVIATAATGPTAARIRVVSDSTPGSADIVSVDWELGDGTNARGTTVTHDYTALGAYTVVLRVRDANGLSDSIRGTVAVTGDATGFGAAERVVGDVLEFDSSLDDLGTGITDSLEDAVGDVGDDINATIDTALGSIGSTVRGGVVVALFALASFAATIVAWRTARIGVMLLVGDQHAGSRNLRRKAVNDEEQPPRHLEAA